MAVHAMQGLMGAGKSCVAVNKFLVDILTTTSRHIYTNLPLRWVGEERHGEVVMEPAQEAPEVRRTAEPPVLWRNKRTGQPAELLEVVAAATRNHGRRSEMMSRIHFLRAGERVPTDETGAPLRYQPLDEEGNAIVGAEPVEVGPKHGVREFWFFTRPNAVVFLDEVADIWSTDDRKNRPDTLKSYIRHHRHYKDDLYFFFQDKEDIDPDLRRKIQYLWTVRNSTKENLSANWMLRGVKWPFLFFIVKCYLGRSVVGKDEASMAKFLPQESWCFFPKKASFRAYWSFSEANTLPGKKAASASAKSSDFDSSVWSKLRGGLRNLAPVISIVGAIAVAIYLGLRFVFLLTGVSSDDITGKRTAPATNAPAVLTNSARVNLTNAAPAVLHLDAGTKTNLLQYGTNAAPVEVVRLTTPNRIFTTKGSYELGDTFAGGRISRIFLDGVEFEGGRRAKFKDLLLQR